MAMKKRTRNASGATAKRRPAAPARRAGASAPPKKRGVSKPRGGPQATRAAAKSTPKRPSAARDAKGAVARGAKRAAGVKKKATKSAGTGSAKRRPVAAQAKGVRAAAARRTQPAVRRRDAAGHIDPDYAADLMAQRGVSDRDDTPTGFIEQPRSDDDLAENLGEEFVESATSGENQEEEVLDQEVPEERGGPFVESTAGTEFAWGTDASNPKGAKREPFPTT